MLPVIFTKMLMALDDSVILLYSEIKEVSA
jgi:hypothetical protein|nr:MAG TPA: hypothetical protein [Caudoviricetes sp.]